MKRLCKSTGNKMVCGVCAGIADYLDIDPTVVRLIWGILIASAGVGLIPYIVAAIVMPRDIDVSGD